MDAQQPAAANRNRALDVAERIARLRSLAKTLYEEMDALTKELQEIVGINIPVPVREKYDMVDGIMIVVPAQVIEVIDNFATKNVMFKTVAARRFEIASENLEERNQRLAKGTK